MIICSDLTKSYSHGGRHKRVLNGINLAIERGDRVGLLGRNGAGKSTLIKLIGGVEMPTSGKIIRNMSVSWPLGFAGGFQGSLTGLDNARFIARIYQRQYADIRRFVEDFTELGKQLNMPVKTYSSGMRARLAFALSLAIEFDCHFFTWRSPSPDIHFCIALQHHAVANNAWQPYLCLQRKKGKKKSNDE